MASVEDLENGIESTEDPMSKLIMEEEKKVLIKAAAGSPREGRALKRWDTEWTADFIEGKGRGRIVFMHGTCALFY